MFFFFSGYGLMLSAKKEGYLKTFLRKRFLSLYLFYVVLIAIYALCSWCFFGHFDIALFAKSFFVGGSVVRFGWFFQTLFLAYLAFWVCFSVAKSERASALAFYACIVGYCVVCAFFGMNGTLYNSILCLMLGAIVQRNKVGIDDLLASRAKLVAFASLLLTAAFIALAFSTPYRTGCQMVSSLAFSAFVISASFLLQDTPILVNRCTKLIGRYSLSIFAAQGLFLGFHFSSPYVWIAFVVAGTAIASVVLDFIYAYIRRICS